ncbi:MAG: AsmA family protein [Devosia sp.]|uniref:AsmA family protein n=1 Tax=Devosia sp. TaxID=1871048 RepID=UPI0024CD2E93|nr:AsmA family protein [Devosia sp.]UYO00756.1 MAG: AsmA family protein [Devosia sp.]
MLNRIYIVVGVLAILVLTAAFLVPRFVQWNDYRDRMETLATSVLGADVTINGAIEFSLLPQPQLRFSDVIVGSTEAPAATVAEVEAQFSLLEFLRDIYNVTALTLHQPVVNLVIDENGLVGSAVDFNGAGSGLALGQARIENGSVRLEDLRAEQTWSLGDIDGDLRLSSFTGPFQFQGGLVYDGSRYDLRYNSGALDSADSTRVSIYLRETAGRHATTAEGLLTLGAAPRFEGNLVYRQTPPVAETADGISGDMVLESSVTVSTDRVVFNGYTLHPDENRAGMRLTGAASIQLGERRDFDAVVSGGVFSLPPRAATETPSELPYEIVRMLSEIPAPPIPPLPGRLGIDLAEVGLRGFALRNVRLDATTDGSAWTIEQGVADLPGETELRLSGTVSNDEGVVGYSGQVSASSARLDALAQLWRRASEDNPLFNMPGSASARVLLANGALGFGDGVFNLDGKRHRFDLRLGYGDEARLDATLNLSEADAPHMAALRALLPSVIGGGSFGASFPNGSFSLTADSADILGLAAADLVAEGQWSPDMLRLSRLATSGWGGVTLDTGLRFVGDPAAPRITASGQVAVDTADSEGLALLQEMAGVPFVWQEALARAFPADLQFILTDQTGGEGQVLTLAGETGSASLDFRAEMASGLLGLATGDLKLIASLEDEDAAALSAQLGLGPVPVMAGDGNMIASLFLEGGADDGFDGRVSVSQGEQSLSFFGRLDVAGNGLVSGDGTIDVLLGAGHGLLRLAGVGGADLGALDGSAAMAFDGTRSLELTTISGVSGEVPFTGDLSMQLLGGVPAFEGNLSADSVDVVALASALLGNEALIGTGASVFPEGPLADDLESNGSRGTVSFTAGAMTMGGSAVGGATDFRYVWDRQKLGVEGLSVATGETGSLVLDMARCCAGPLPERTVSGRLALSGVDLSALPAPLTSNGLGGRVDMGLQFEGTGASLADVVRRLAGEGNLAIADMTVSGLTPQVYPAIAGFGDLLDMDDTTLETLIGLALSQGAFEAEQAQGTFTIAQGIMRMANFIVEGDGGRLSGNLNLSLPTLGLDGSFVLTPFGFTDPTGLVEPDGARIIARLAGTVLAPLVTLDLAEIVASIQVRANELEVDRLEALRLAEEARQRAAAKERNRLVEEQLRQAEEAARLRAEEEARRLEEEQLLNPQPLPEEEVVNQPLTPLDLGFQPGVNQPIGDPVNQPLQLFP